MSAEQLAEANALLASPPPVGLALSRSLGFIVVGRLARRLRVERAPERLARRWRHRRRRPARRRALRRRRGRTGATGRPRRHRLRPPPCHSATSPAARGRRPVPGARRRRRVPGDGFPPPEPAPARRRPGHAVRRHPRRRRLRAGPGLAGRPRPGPRPPTRTSTAPSGASWPTRRPTTPSPTSPAPPTDAGLPAARHLRRLRPDRGRPGVGAGTRLARRRAGLGRDLHARAAMAPPPPAPAAPGRRPAAATAGRRPLTRRTPKADARGRPGDARTVAARAGPGRRRPDARPKRCGRCSPATAVGSKTAGKRPATED